MKPFATAAPLLAALILFGGCSSAPRETPRKAAEKTPQPLTGRQAFQQMFPQVRAWARDAQPLTLRSIDLADVKAGQGKSGAWECTFVSDSLHKSKSWTWSAIEGPGNLHEGVFAGSEGDWAGPTGQEQPFDVSAIRTDSDAAYEIAMQQKDSVAFEKKNPDKHAAFLLQKTPRFPDVAWRVMWGESVSTAAYSVFVDATLGKYLTKVE